MTRGSKNLGPPCNGEKVCHGGGGGCGTGGCVMAWFFAIILLITKQTIHKIMIIYSLLLGLDYSSFKL